MNKLHHVTEQDLTAMLNDCSIDRIMAIDNEWNIIAWNRTAEIHSGVKKESILGNTLLTAFPSYREDKEIIAAIKTALSGIKSFVPADKEFAHRLYYENHFIPLRDNAGYIIGVMNIMHDVSHRIKAERQLRELNIELKKKYEELERTNEELSTITHIASNNIKAPLRLVYSGIELLVRAEARTLSDGSKANLRRIQASLNRMNLLLDDMLALSDIKTIVDDEQLIDLNEVLRKAMQHLSEKIKASDIQIAVSVLPTVKGHREMLFHLFSHLIQHAIRSRQNNKPVHLTIASQTNSFLSSDAQQLSGRLYMRVSFTDNGIGFAPEEAASIFLITNQGNNKQLKAGAHLAICRKIMLAHEGFIQAEGAHGHGSTIHCYFPVTIEK